MTMWTIDLSKIEEEGLPVEKTLERVEFLPAYPEFAGTPSVRVAFFLRRVGEGRFSLDGNVLGSVPALCSRCVEGFPLEFMREFHLLLEPRVEDGAAAGETELTPDTETVVQYTDGSLDVENLVEEQINLALPMKLLCRTECKGLCPRCGVNRNEAACGCREEDIDPRLAPLKKLVSD